MKTNLFLYLAQSGIVVSVTFIDVVIYLYQRLHVELHSSESAIADFSEFWQCGNELCYVPVTLELDLII